MKKLIARYTLEFRSSRAGVVTLWINGTKTKFRAGGCGYNKISATLSDWIADRFAEELTKLPVKDDEFLQRIVKFKKSGALSHVEDYGTEPLWRLMQNYLGFDEVVQARTGDSDAAIFIAERYAEEREPKDAVTEARIPATTYTGYIFNNIVESAGADNILRQSLRRFQNYLAESFETSAVVSAYVVCDGSISPEDLEYYSQDAKDTEWVLAYNFLNCRGYINEDGSYLFFI